MGAMRRWMTAAVSSWLGATGAVHASDAVQWRVEDGGNGHWYQRVVQQYTWDAARMAAQSSGGHLATITSQGEQHFLTAIGAPEYWLGGIAPVNQGCGPAAWTWVTGEPMSYLGWAAGEPGTCSHTCMAFAIWGGYTGRWNNDMCTRPDAPGFMIEWSADCNADGIVDYGQILAGQLADSNGNNIPDTCEAGFVSWAPVVNAGTSPSIPLRDFDLGEGLAIGIRPDGALLSMGPYVVTPPSGVFASVSAGRQCAIAIRSDGVLIPFGANEYGRLNVPAGSFRSVSAADATWHAAAIRTDGTVACWGYNNYGQANAPEGMFTAVAAGGHEVWSGFTIAIRTNGSLAAWGNNSWGQLGVPAGSNFRRIAAGYYHALAVRIDNTLAGWGWNDYGQASVPSGQFVDVSCGSTESIALRADGTVVTFGSIPASVVNYFASRTGVIKAQIFCCEGAIALESKDCDGNGAFDAVEIAQNPSLDADTNGALDLCENTITVPTQYPTIQAAIDSVPAGGAKSINVLAGTYNQSFSMNGKNIVIRGAAGGTTILDGTGLQDAIALLTGGEPATAGLENLVFRNGTVGSRFNPKAAFTIGGAIYANNSNAFLRDCRFEGCRADYGGAIYQYSGTMDWDNLVFVDNTANDEGGAALVYNVTGTATNSTFTGNRCGMFGPGSGSAFKAVGANQTGESVTLEGCSITNNIALDFGAAIEFYEHVKYRPGVLRLVNCSISDNISGDPVASGPGGLRILGGQSSCVLSGGTTICGNQSRNILGPYYIEGSATVCDCEGDISGNGSINAADLGILLSLWGTSPEDGQADLNHDGLVNAADLSALLAAWGPCPNG
jgi:hypothetical protein